MFDTYLLWFLYFQAICQFQCSIRLKLLALKEEDQGWHLLVGTLAGSETSKFWNIMEAVFSWYADEEQSKATQGKVNLFPHLGHDCPLSFYWWSQNYYGLY